MRKQDTLREFLCYAEPEFNDYAERLKQVLTKALEHETSHYKNYESKAYRIIHENSLDDLIADICNLTRQLATPTDEEYAVALSNTKKPYEDLPLDVLDTYFREYAIRLRSEFGTYKRTSWWSNKYQKIFDINSIVQNMAFIANAYEQKR